MKTRLVATLTLFLLAGTAVGQDFRKVVEIVDEMETSLKKMITKEQAERKTEIASLRNEVLALRQSLAHGPTMDRSDNAAVPIASVEELARRMDILEKRINGVPQSADLSQLTGQLNTLVAELKKGDHRETFARAAQVKPAAHASRDRHRSRMSCRVRSATGENWTEGRSCPNPVRSDTTCCDHGSTC